MYDYLSIDQINEMNKQLNSAQVIVDKKNNKSEKETNKELEKLEKQFEKQKVSFQNKFKKLEEKRLVSFSKLNKKYENKKSTIEYKAMEDSLINLFEKRKQELTVKLDNLTQNYELAIKDTVDGAIGNENYNHKVYIEKIEYKYQKKNYWQAYKNKKEQLNPNLDKKELFKAEKELKWKLYNNSNKLYAPLLIKLTNSFNHTKTKVQLNWLEFKTKWNNCLNWTFKEWMTVKIWSIPIYLLIPIIGIIIAVIATNIVEPTMMYAIAILLVISIVFGSIFAKIPIWNKYFGGALLGCMFIGSMFVYFNVPGFNAPVSDIIDGKKEIVKEAGQVYATVDAWFRKQDFLGLYISVLLVGAVLLIPRKMIIRATTGFFGVIIGGVVVASLFGYISSLITNTSFKTLVLDYWLPILSDGNGGGIQPIGRIAEQNGYDSGIWMSRALAISTLASVLSVLMAAGLNVLGKVKPSLSGDGQLLRRNLHTIEIKAKPAPKDVVGAIVIILAIYLLSDIIAKVILPEKVLGILVPNFAWMIIISMALNLMNCITPNLKDGIDKTNKFISKQTTWLLMLAVGIIYINLQEFISALNPTSLLICISFVIGVTIGSLLTAKLLKFYGIEAALSAGLCMTAQGGTGAIMVLGTSERMELMPWGQITCRIAGSFMLIFAGIAFASWPGNQEVVSQIMMF